MTTPKMKVEVWTDIMCPYCYIGKIHYERALAKFEHAHEVELVFKAFQLSPDLPDRGNGYPAVDYLVNQAGVPQSSIGPMFERIKKLADNAGIRFNLQHSVAANTRDAHRMIKLATTRGVESKFTTLVSKAYFEDALDYSDIELLVKLGIEAGLEETEIRDMLNSDGYKAEVLQDIEEARRLGIDTVPTFLFERQRAIIGSQPEEAYLDALKKSYAVWKQEQSAPHEMEITKGKSCGLDGVCE